MDLITVDEASLVGRARSAGYTLLQRELDGGELVWTWRHPDDPRQPTFFDRRDALAYIESRVLRASPGPAASG